MERRGDPRSSRFDCSHSRLHDTKEILKIVSRIQLVRVERQNHIIFPDASFLGRISFLHCADVLPVRTIHQPLESIRGWAWNGREAIWEEAFRVLCGFVERENHARVPAKHIEGNAKLGIWVQNQRRIYGLILALVPNGPDADDIPQETCAVLWQKFDEFDPGTNWADWIRFPFRPGYSMAARVVAAGGDSDVRPGDLIASWTPHAQRFVVEAAAVNRVPAGVSGAWRRSILRCTSFGICAAVSLETITIVTRASGTPQIAGCSISVRTSGRLA